MYVTRPLSKYLADPEASAEMPPDGPGSGLLVVLDDAAEQASTLCCGLCLHRSVRGLPLPQNRQLRVSQATSCADILECLIALISALVSSNASNVPSCDAPSDSETAYEDPPDYAVFVPVVGQPLSSGRYYVVKVDGKHAGKVSTCSKEEDATSCCFCSVVPAHVKPRAFVHGDVYQQVQVQVHGEGFRAEAVADDGIPPRHLMEKGWTLVARAKPKYPLLQDALGVDSALRNRMPDLDGPAAVVVGRWYVPFLFVKADGRRRLKDQARKTMFYKMTMEQSWEEIYSRENTTHLQGTEIDVAANVRRFTALLGGTAAVRCETDGRAVWFRPAVAAARTWCCGGSTDRGVGLDMVLWERMKWELERDGRWAGADGTQDEERIERTERRNDGLGHWTKFACYLLVERFVLRRMDGTVALTCEFRHTDKIRAKWE